MSLNEIALYIHIAAIFAAIAGVLWADKVAFAWFRGKTPTITHTKLHTLHAYVGITLGVLVGSGSILFWPMREYLLTQPLFILKLTFVAILIANSLVIDRLLHHAITTPYAALDRTQKIPLLISGAVSGICWAGTIAIGLYLFF